MQDISNTVIVWPDEEERANIQRGFLAKVKGRGIPNVIGYVDGSHIEIKKPNESPDSYYNRKKYHSVVLQAICDHQMKLLDVFIGFPGSTHDARVMRSSFFFTDAPTKCAGGYILGDAAYPLLPWLLTPYKNVGREFPAWKKYNHVRSQQRIAIEHAFGALKQRFQRIYYIDADSIEHVCLVILGSCVLHNVCTAENELDDFCPARTSSTEESLEEEEPSTSQAAARRFAEEIRRQIALTL